MEIFIAVSVGDSGGVGFRRKFHGGALTSDLQPVQESARLVGDALNALQPEALFNGVTVTMPLEIFQAGVEYIYI